MAKKQTTTPTPTRRVGGCWAISDGTQLEMRTIRYSTALRALLLHARENEGAARSRKDWISVLPGDSPKKREKVFFDLRQKGFFFREVEKRNQPYIFIFRSYWGTNDEGLVNPPECDLLLWNDSPDEVVNPPEAVVSVRLPTEQEIRVQLGQLVDKRDALIPDQTGGRTSASQETRAKITDLELKVRGLLAEVQEAEAEVTELGKRAGAQDAQARKEAEELVEKIGLLETLLDKHSTIAELFPGTD
jgi:hypothetical protein